MIRDVIRGILSKLRPIKLWHVWTGILMIIINWISVLHVLIQKTIAVQTSSVSPFYATDIYDGGAAASKGSGNVNHNAAMYFENSRYFKEYNFTSYASEWNSKWLDGSLNNVTRVTYLSRMSQEVMRERLIFQQLIFWKMVRYMHVSVLMSFLRGT